jgi:PAS domain S-box-containing protein
LKPTWNFLEAAKLDVERDDEVLELFTRTEDGVFAVDAAHRIMLWNDAAQRILGFSAAEVLGKPCFSVVSGLDQAAMRYARWTAG